MSELTDEMETTMWGDDFDEEAQAARETSWRKGKHETREGVVLKIKDMTTTHIQNTINYFEGYDHTPLEKELKKRKRHVS